MPNQSHSETEAVEKKTVFVVAVVSQAVVKSTPLVAGHSAKHARGLDKMPYIQRRIWKEWVNRSNSGGKYRLAGVLRGISRGQSLRDIPRSNPASPRKTQSFWTHPGILSEHRW